MPNKGLTSPTADRMAADAVDATWTSGNEHMQYDLEGLKFYTSEQWRHLVCDCDKVKFEIYQTDMFETAARCWECGRWFVVHVG